MQVRSSESRFGASQLRHSVASRVPRTLFMGSFPPRECGIATFTKDVVDNFDALYGTPERRHRDRRTGRRSARLSVQRRRQAEERRPRFLCRCRRADQRASRRAARRAARVRPLWRRGRRMVRRPHRARPKAGRRLAAHRPARPDARASRARARAYARAPTPSSSSRRQARTSSSASTESSPARSA